MLSNMSVDTTHYTASRENQPWSTLGLLALAASQGGAYLGFSLQYALLTPFVLELGVPVRWASIIWLGGPITGMVVQPFVGRLSDGQRSGENGSSGFMHVVTKRFGRRRPFLALGGFVLLLAQLLVGNSADLGHLLGDGITDALRIRAVVIFTLGFWLLDASNNAIWVVSKSLTADVVPEAQWPEAFSYSTAATGLGLALGYVLGGVHWSPRLPWLKTTACNDVGGCADLRFAFLLACVSCVLANLCTLLVGKESGGASRGGANSQSHSHQHPEGDVHTPLLEGECRAWKVVRQNQALSSAYLVTLLAWLGWISLQMYQTEFVAKEVFQGSPDQTSPLNKAYVEGVHAASRALVINALLMTLTTYAIPKAIRSMGKANLWCLATLFTALLLAASLAICKTHAKDGASLWLALLGPVYGVQQTIPFLVVSEEAPKELLGELNGYLNVALCIPQLLVSLLGGAVISIVGSDTLLFGLGAVCDLVAAGICMKFLHQ